MQTNQVPVDIAAENVRQDYSSDTDEEYGNIQIKQQLMRIVNEAIQQGQYVYKKEDSSIIGRRAIKQMIEHISNTLQLFDSDTEENQAALQNMRSHTYISLKNGYVLVLKLKRRKKSLEFQIKSKSHIDSSQSDSSVRQFNSSEDEGQSNENKSQDMGSTNQTSPSKKSKINKVRIFKPVYEVSTHLEDESDSSEEINEEQGEGQKAERVEEEIIVDTAKNLEHYKQLFKRVHRCLNEFGISDRTNEKSFKSKRKAFLLSESRLQEKAKKSNSDLETASDSQ